MWCSQRWTRTGQQEDGLLTLWHRSHGMPREIVTCQNRDLLYSLTSMSTFCRYILDYTHWVTFSTVVWPSLVVRLRYNGVALRFILCDQMKAGGMAYGSGLAKTENLK